MVACRLRNSCAVALASFAAAALAQDASQKPQEAEAAEPGARVRYDGHKLVNVTLRSEQDLERMLSISGDHWSCSVGLGVVPFRVAPEALPELQASGLKYEVLIEDIQPLLEREQRRLAQRGEDFFGDYRTYSEISAYVDQLVALRPGPVVRASLGNSLEGREIFAVRIAGAGGPAGLPALLLSGTQHAREWLSPMTVMYIADRLVRDYGVDPRITRLLDACTVHIVPIVNPDGYEYAWTTDRLWRKNRRNNGNGSFGVDLNRNWGYQWGGPGSSGNTWSETYRGLLPFSEPETRAVRDYVLLNPQIVGHIDFHTYSQLILSPWGYTLGDPGEPDGPIFARLNARMRESIAQTHGMYYEAGPGGQTLYLASGIFPDWSYGARGIFAWTIELRPIGPPGFTPGPEYILPTGEESLEAVLALANSLSDPVAIDFPGGRAEVIAPDEAAVVRIELVELRAAYAPGSAQLYARVGTSGPFTPVAFISAGGAMYEAALPPAACGSQVQYYVQLQTDAGETIRSPRFAPLDLYTASVQPVYFQDDMESDLGWVVGAPDDTATSGIWARQDPQAMHRAGLLFQPEDDHTDGGARCYVTDGRREPLGERYDVSGGKTTLLSPLLDLSGALDPVLRYWFWYSNSISANPNEDVFEVDVSADGGQTWTPLDVFGPTGSGPGWRLRELHLTDVIQPSAQVRIRFVASDYGGDSRVEAAVDDLVVFDAACPSPNCLADLNGDGQRDLLDLSLLLAAYGTCEGGPGYDTSADLDGSSCVDLGDLSTLLSVFGTACD